MKLILENCHAAYVNLEARQRRREIMEERLRRLGIKAERYKALLPYEVDAPKEKIQAMWDRPQKGAIGCHFSQLACMQMAYVKKKHAFVMEDDLDFCSDFHRRLAIVSKFCSNHAWDIIWLGGTFHVNPPHWHGSPPGRGCTFVGRDAETTDHPRMIRTYGCFCTYAYIVNYLALPRLFTLFQKYTPQSIGIDHLMIMIQPFLMTYAFVPGMIKQYDHMSDIGVDRKGNPSMTTFSNFAKLGPYWWQDRMEDFDPTTFNWAEAQKHSMHKIDL